MCMLRCVCWVLRRGARHQLHPSTLHPSTYHSSRLHSYAQWLAQQGPSGGVLPSHAYVLQSRACQATLSSVIPTSESIANKGRKRAARLLQYQHHPHRPSVYLAPEKVSCGLRMRKILVFTCLSGMSRCLHVATASFRSPAELQCPDTCPTHILVHALSLARSQRQTDKRR